MLVQTLHCRDLFQQQLSNDWLAHLSSDGGFSDAYFVWEIVKVRPGKCANHFSSSLRLFLLKYSHSQFIFYYSTTEELTMERAHHGTGRQLQCSRYASWKCFNNMTKWFLKSRNWLESQNFLWIGQLKLLLQRDLFYNIKANILLVVDIYLYWDLNGNMDSCVRAVSCERDLAELCTIFPVTPTWAYRITPGLWGRRTKYSLSRKLSRFTVSSTLLIRARGPDEIVDLLSQNVGKYPVWHGKINRHSGGPGPVSRQPRTDVTAAYKH